MEKIKQKNMKNEKPSEWFNDIQIERTQNFNETGKSIYWFYGMLLKILSLSFINLINSEKKLLKFATSISTIIENSRIEEDRTLGINWPNQSQVSNLCGTWTRCSVVRFFGFMRWARAIALFLSFNLGLNDKNQRRSCWYIGV